MKKQSNLIKFVLICLTALSLASCTNTRLISTWETGMIDQFSPEKILIAGISNDLEKRIMFESALAEAFKQRGVDAVPSSSLFPELKNIDEGSVIAEAENQGIDFVMITRIIEIGVNNLYVPEYNPILTGYYSKERNDYGQIQKYQKTTCVSQHHVKLRSDLINSATGDVVWSGVSDTMKPDSQPTAWEALLSITSTISEELIALKSHSS